MRENEEDIQYNEKALSKSLIAGLVLRRTPYSDLIISQEILNKIKNELRKTTYTSFCNWVLRQDNTKLDHSQDPPEHIMVDKTAWVAQYSTIGQWIKEEYTTQFETKIWETCSYLAWETIFSDIPDEEQNTQPGELTWRDANIADCLESNLEDALFVFCQSIITATRPRAKFVVA